GPPEKVLPPLEVREDHPQVTPQEDESALAEPQLDDPSLLRVQPQVQPFHDEAQAAVRFLRVCPRAAQDHEIVAVAHEYPDVLTAALPDSVESVQVDVSE